MVNTIFFYVRYALDVRSSLLNVEYITGRSSVFDQIRKTRGAAVIEYGIMTGMMAIAFAGTVGVLGGRLSTIFHIVVRSLSG